MPSSSNRSHTENSRALITFVKGLPSRESSRSNHTSSRSNRNESSMTARPTSQSRNLVTAYESGRSHREPSRSNHVSGRNELRDLISSRESGRSNREPSHSHYTSSRSPRNESRDLITSRGNGRSNRELSRSSHTSSRYPRDPRELRAGMPTIYDDDEESDCDCGPEAPCAFSMRRNPGYDSAMDRFGRARNADMPGSMSGPTGIGQSGTQYMAYSYRRVTIERVNVLRAVRD